MLNKYNILNKLIETGIVAVIRANDLNEAKRISTACIQGGITAIEITYTTPNASFIISELNKEFSHKNLLIGAGTVLDSETARIAILAGAKYIVSPAFDENTAKLCNRYQIPYMPGCMTITEMITSLELGCDIIKLFPGSNFGPDFIKGVKAPLPQINIMPTGGVSLDNVQEWFKNGVIAVGVGGKLASGKSDDITNTAIEFIKKIKEIKEVINNV